MIVQPKCELYSLGFMCRDTKLVGLDKPTPTQFINSASQIKINTMYRQKHNKRVSVTKMLI